MFHWLRRKAVCPLPDADQLWLESLFHRLIGEFGISRLREVQQVTPTTDFFPADWQGTDHEARQMLDLLCEFMSVKRSTVTLGFYEEARPQTEGWSRGSAGLYSKSGWNQRLWLERSGLADPLGTVATLAHETGHVILLGEGRISPIDDDHEPLTDLLTVFLGLGIIVANSIVHEDYWHSGVVSGWKVGRKGYLSMDQMGYALAGFASCRDESQPAWLRHLRPDVRSSCRCGLRYLAQNPQRLQLIIEGGQIQS